jgi:hypothetical protein
VNDDIDFKDFTVPRKRFGFRVAPDNFECVPALAPASLQSVVRKFQSAEFRDLVKAGAQADADKTLGAIQDIFNEFLIDEDTESRFAGRLADRRNPIDIHQLVEIIGWVIEHYTARPTEPSPSSSKQYPSGDGGTNSVDGAQPDLSHLWNLPLTGSST